jgi:chromosome segregation ATPase
MTFVFLRKQQTIKELEDMTAIAVEKFNTLIATIQDERAEVAAALGAFSNQIQELNGQVSVLTGEAQGRLVTIQTQAETIAALEAALASGNVDIAEFQRIIGELTSQNASLSASNSELSSQINSLDIGLDNAIAEVENIYVQASGGNPTPPAEEDEGNGVDNSPND